MPKVRLRAAAANVDCIFALSVGTGINAVIHRTRGFRGLRPDRAAG